MKAFGFLLSLIVLIGAAVVLSISVTWRTRSELRTLKSRF